MTDAKNAIPNLSSAEEIAEYWDTNSLADQWEETEAADFDLDTDARRRYLVGLDRDLLARAQRLARERGLSTESMVNLLLEQRLTQLEAI